MFWWQGMLCKNPLNYVCTGRPYKLKSEHSRTCISYWGWSVNPPPPPPHTHTYPHPPIQHVKQKIMKQKNSNNIRKTNYKRPTNSTSNKGNVWQAATLTYLAVFDLCEQCVQQAVLVGDLVRHSGVIISWNNQSQSTTEIHTYTVESSFLEITNHSQPQRSIHTQWSHHFFK